MQLSTGLIIAGAYADKVRKVAFAQLKDELKRGNITPQTIVRRTAELNRLLYDILVNRLKVDKGDVVRIRIEYEVRNGDIEWKLDTLQIEVFRRVTDEEVRKAIEETVKTAEQVLAAPPTAEEREWTKEETPPARPTEVWKPSEDIVAETAFIGETEAGEKVATIYNRDGDSAGLVVLAPANGRTRVKVILIPKAGEAYIGERVVDRSVEEIYESEVKKMVLEMEFRKADPKEAQKLIREKMMELR